MRECNDTRGDTEVANGQIRRVHHAAPPATVDADHSDDIDRGQAKLTHDRHGYQRFVRAGIDEHRQHHGIVSGR